MNNETQTHYRKVFMSDHLGVVDLEGYIEAGSDLIFTVSHVNQEMDTKVAGKKINANIAYFNEEIKPLVLNATNSKTMKELSGSCFVENWKDITIQLYINYDAKLMGEVVGGVRISPKKVRVQKRVVCPENKNMWKNAKAAFLKDKNFNAVLKRAEMSKEHQNQMITEIENA